MMRRVVENGDIDPHRIDISPAHRHLHRDQVIFTRLNTAPELLDLLVGEHLIDLDAILFLQLFIVKMLRRCRTRIADDDHESRHRLRQTTERERPLALGIEDLVEALVAALARNAARLVVHEIRYLTRILDRRVIDGDALLAEIHIIHRRHDHARVNAYASGLDEPLRKRRRQVLCSCEKLRKWYAGKRRGEINPRAFLLGIFRLGPLARGFGSARTTTHVAPRAISAATIIAATPVFETRRSRRSLRAVPFSSLVAGAPRMHPVALLHCQRFPMNETRCDP